MTIYVRVYKTFSQPTFRRLDRRVSREMCVDYAMRTVVGARRRAYSAALVAGHSRVHYTYVRARSQWPQREQR